MKYILSMFVLLILFFSCFLPFQRTRVGISPAEQAVNAVLRNSVKEIHHQLGLVACGSGAAMPDNRVRNLYLSFNTQEQKSRDELRSLLLRAADIMLEQMRASETLQKYLVDTPLTLKNVQIAIFNIDERGYTAHDPHISVINSLEGILRYNTIDPQNTFVYKNTFSETYDEAVELNTKYVSQRK